MVSNKIIPRFVETRLVEALEDSPAVLIHGPRQSGKTTLAQMVGKKRGYRYFNLDDDVLRAAAEEDPMGFVGDLPSRTILDEVQRVPTLFTALKSAIDGDRSPGRFLLTDFRFARTFLGRRIVQGSAGYRVDRVLTRAAFTAFVTRLAGQKCE
jgi:uncharacterized protein